MAVEFSQLTDLRVELDTVSGRIGPVASRVLRKTAYDIEADAKVLAPVDTGALRSSIETVFAGLKSGRVMAAEIGPTVGYAAYVEYGTSTQGPQPFLGPAFDRNVASFEAALGQAAERSLLSEEG